MTATLFPALTEVEGKLKQRNETLATIFAEASTDAGIDLSKVKSVAGGQEAVLAEIRKLNEETTALGKERDSLKQVAIAAEQVKRHREAGEQAAAESGDGNRKAAPAVKGEVKSFGELFVESDAFLKKQGNSGPESHLDIELKTLMTTSAGWTPETTRNGRIVEFATRPLQVVDIIPTTTTQQAAIVYMEETTFTNNAAEIAEAGTYPESALALTEQSSPVRKIGTWLPITDEQLEDVTQAKGYVNNRLPFMVRQRLDGQLLVGNGTAPNLRGLLNTVGIQTQAKGADPVPDAVYKAMVKVMTIGQAMPNVYITNPLDWQDVRLLRTADGVYIWGNPSDAGPERIWGLAVAMAQVQTADTGVVADTSFLELSVRRGMDVQVSNSHSTFFVEGKQAVRADIRVAFVVYRPTAVCQVTGI